MKKLTWLFLICVIVGCKKENIESEFPDFSHLRPVITARGTSLGAPRTAQIGPAGGELRSEDGRLMVSIPAGALTNTVTVGVEPISNNAPLGLGTGYRLTPEGVNFAKPVKLTFSYENTMLRGTAAEFLWIVSQKADGTWEGDLRSELDAAARTVSMETSHFSDWILGKMINLELLPSSAVVKVKNSVDLMVTGFLNDEDINDDDLLVPLTPVNHGSISENDLVPLDQVSNILLKLDKFAMLNFKEWRLDGAKAPISNSKGKLEVYGIEATYTAPGNKPSPDNVAVTVTIEARQKDGKAPTISINAPITISDKEYYAKFSFGGTEFEYFSTAEFTVSDGPKGEGTTGAAYREGTLMFGVGSAPGEATAWVHGFSFSIKNPVSGVNVASCTNNTESSVTFGWLKEAPRGYENLNLNYSKNDQQCLQNRTCNPVTVILNDFKTGVGSVLSGTVSGTLQYNDRTNCTSRESISFSGEFYVPLQ